MFGWKDVLAGLDEGLDVAKTIAALVPGGQGIAVGLSAVDVLVNKANMSVNGDGHTEQSTKQTLPAPIQTSLDILEGVVKAKDNGTGIKIDNNAVVSLLEVVSKSTGNGLDDKIVCMVKAYINCSGQVSEEVTFPWMRGNTQQAVAAPQQPQQVSKFHDDQPAFVAQTQQQGYVVERPYDRPAEKPQVVYHQEPMQYLSQYQEPIRKEVKTLDDDLGLSPEEMNPRHHKFDGD